MRTNGTKGIKGSRIGNFHGRPLWLTQDEVTVGQNCVRAGKQCDERHGSIMNN